MDESAKATQSRSLAPNRLEPFIPHWLTRRNWLQTAAVGGLSSFVLFPQLAPDGPLREALYKMAVMTGVELPEPWQQPTAALVGVILDYSRSLRALELGEIEPATFFAAR